MVWLRGQYKRSSKRYIPCIKVHTLLSITDESRAQLLVRRPLCTHLDMVNTNLNRKMANQQHQLNIKTANEKGRQRRQLVDGDSVILRDYRGIQGGLSSRQVHWRSRCRWRQGLSLVVMLTSWGRQQLGPRTSSGQPSIGANPKECTSPCGWFNSRDAFGTSTRDGFCSSTYSYQSSRSDPSQFVTATPRECARHHRGSISELLFIWGSRVRGTVCWVCWF